MSLDKELFASVWTLHIVLQDCHDPEQMPVIPCSARKPSGLRGSWRSKRSACLISWYAVMGSSVITHPSRCCAILVAKMITCYNMLSQVAPDQRPRLQSIRWGAWLIPITCMEVIPMKTCSRCLTPKPLDQFYNRINSSDGKHPWCKACCRDYKQTDEYKSSSKAYRQKNREKIHAYNMSRREKTKAYNQEYLKNTVKNLRLRIKDIVSAWLLIKFGNHILSE